MASEADKNLGAVENTDEESTEAKKEKTADKPKEITANPLQGVYEFGPFTKKALPAYNINFSQHIAELKEAHIYTGNQLLARLEKLAQAAIPEKTEHASAPVSVPNFSAHTERHEKFLQEFHRNLELSLNAIGNNTRLRNNPQHAYERVRKLRSENIQKLEAAQEGERKEFATFLDTQKNSYKDKDEREFTRFKSNAMAEFNKAKLVEKKELDKCLAAACSAYAVRLNQYEQNMAILAIGSIKGNESAVIRNTSNERIDNIENKTTYTLADQAIYTLSNGARVYCQGKTMTLDASRITNWKRAHKLQAAREMVLLAKTKGWKSMRIHQGLDPEMADAIWLEAMKMGMPLDPGGGHVSSVDIQKEWSKHREQMRPELRPTPIDAYIRVEDPDHPGQQMPGPIEQVRQATVKSDEAVQTLELLKQPFQEAEADKFYEAKLLARDAKHQELRAKFGEADENSQEVNDVQVAKVFAAEIREDNTRLLDVEQMLEQAKTLREAVVTQLQYAHALPALPDTEFEVYTHKSEHRGENPAKYKTHSFQTTDPTTGKAITASSPEGVKRKIKPSDMSVEDAKLFERLNQKDQIIIMIPEELTQLQQTATIVGKEITQLRKLQEQRERLTQANKIDLKNNSYKTYNESGEKFKKQLEKIERNLNMLKNPRVALQQQIDIHKAAAKGDDKTQAQYHFEEAQRLEDQLQEISAGNNLRYSTLDSLVAAQKTLKDSWIAKHGTLDLPESKAADDQKQPSLTLNAGSGNS